MTRIWKAFTQTLIIVLLVAWSADASARRKKDRDYLELFGGLGGHAGVADPYGVVLGAGGAFGLGFNIEHVGVTLGAITGLDAQASKLGGEQPGIVFAQVSLDLEFMHYLRPAKNDPFFIVGASTTLMSLEDEMAVTSGGLRLGGGIDVPISSWSSGSFFRFSEWLVGFRGVGNVSLNIPVERDPFPVRFDLFVDAHLKVHFTLL